MPLTLECRMNTAHIAVGTADRVRLRSLPAPTCFCSRLCQRYDNPCSFLPLALTEVFEDGSLS